MSAEPGRKAPYGDDIRWRVVWQRTAMELTFREISKNLNVSIGTAYNIFKLFENTGSVSPTKPDREDTRILTGHEELCIVGLLLDNPALYLREVCQVFDVSSIVVSEPTVCRIIHRHGFTRKRIQKIASQRRSQYRGEFMAEVQFYKTEQFVWIDESGCDKGDNIRKFGYALRGERPVYHRLLHRGKRVSAIAAFCTDGVVAVELTLGTVDGDTFIDYVRGSLIPNMFSFDGSSPRSIAVLDNCSIHHMEQVVKLFREAGILVLWLPPYSPDFNPAENAFSKVKYYLKEHDEILQAVDDPLPVIKAAFDSITPEDCIGWIHHCGY